MYRFIKKLLLLGLTLILAILIFAPTSASAKTHFTKTTTPKSFRGTWESLERWDKIGDGSPLYCRFKIKKYTVDYGFRSYPNGKFRRELIWRGNKASWENKKHSDLLVKNKKHGKWLIGGLERMTYYNTVYKVVKHHGKKALKPLTFSYIYMDDVPGDKYFYKVAK